MTYIDSRGWRYQVRSGIGGDRWKAFYLKPGKTGWHACGRFPWRRDKDHAEADLMAHAIFNGWKKNAF